MSLQAGRRFSLYSRAEHKQGIQQPHMAHLKASAVSSSYMMFAGICLLIILSNSVGAPPSACLQWVERQSLNTLENAVLEVVVCRTCWHIRCRAGRGCLLSALLCCCSLLRSFYFA